MGNIDHPSHYRSDTGFEAIDVIEAWGLGFNLGNAVKYISRAGLKGDALEDLRKAQWYLGREIETREAEEMQRPAPMESTSFTTDVPGRPLTVSAEGGRVRLALGDACEAMTPQDARELADAVARGEICDCAAFVSADPDGEGTRIRVGAEECVLTEAQAEILACVLDEKADDAEGGQ